MIQKQIRFVSDMTSNTIDDMYFEMHPVSVTCIHRAVYSSLFIKAGIPETLILIGSIVGFVFLEGRIRIRFSRRVGSGFGFLGGSGSDSVFPEGRIQFSLRVGSGSGFPGGSD